jgi:hypothetical protein
MLFIYQENALHVYHENKAAKYRNCWVMTIEKCTKVEIQNIECET